MRENVSAARGLGPLQGCPRIFILKKETVGHKELSAVAGLIVVHDARAMSNVGTHKLMALVSNTQMNVEHNTELSALAVAFYKSQSQTLTICSTTSLATECQTRCLGKPMRVRPLLPNGINNQSLPWFTGKRL